MDCSARSVAEHSSTETLTRSIRQPPTSSLPTLLTPNFPADWSDQMQTDSRAACGIQCLPVLQLSQHPIHQSSGMGYVPIGQLQYNPQSCGNNFIAGHDSQHTLVDNNSGAMRSKNEAAIKDFICSTCFKGFARSSDLARHGKRAMDFHLKILLMLYRTHSQWYPALCL